MLPAPPRAHPSERQLARVGPLTVTRSSLLGVRALIGVAVLVNAVLLGFVLTLWARLRRTETTLAEKGSAEPERTVRRPA